MYLIISIILFIRKYAGQLVYVRMCIPAYTMWVILIQFSRKVVAGLNPFMAVGRLQEVVYGLYGIEGSQRDFNKYSIPEGHPAIPEPREF